MDLKLNGNQCQQCKNKVEYNTQYDAYYCQSCDNWLEDTCSDSECEFCSQRPAHPNQIEN